MLALTWGLQVCYSIFIHTEFSVEVSMGQRIVPFGWPVRPIFTLLIMKMSDDIGFKSRFSTFFKIVFPCM